MKQANAFTAYVQAPQAPEQMVATQPTLSIMTISPVGNAITIEQLAEWDAD
jgi:hypothetical protein